MLRDDSPESALGTVVELVVPVYNEERRFPADDFARFLASAEWCRMRFVDDGSTDDSVRHLGTLSKLFPGRVVVDRLQENRGKAEAVRYGLAAAVHSGADYVGFWDADLSTPLDALPLFRAVLDEEPVRDLVLGSRVRLLGRAIERRQQRHYLGRVFATLASLALGVPVYDTQCGAKLMRASPEIAALLHEPFLSRWIFDVELLARYLQRTGKGESGIVEVPLHAWRDVPGSRLTLSDFGRAPLELFRIARRYRRSSSPPGRSHE